MSKAQRFNVSSDYATLRNDSTTQTLTISVPNTDSISAGGYKNYTVDITIGTIGAPMEWQISYSSGTQKWLGNNLQVVENAGAGNQYQGNVYIYRTSATNVRMTLSYYNGTGSPITTKARTVTATLRTYIPPFS